MTTIEVQHWSGAGNRFVLLDNRNQHLNSPSKNLIEKLCHRIHLPFAEGLLIFIRTNDDQSVVDYEFYNPDGSTGVMCGNGARCAVRHALKQLKSNRTNVELILNGRSYQTELIEADRVALRLSSYNALKFFDRWTYINVGSEHIVVDLRSSVRTIDEFQRFPLVKFAEENLDDFRKQTNIFSLNVNIAFLTSDDDLIHLRTYENGVFDETQACGTGAISTALAFFKRNEICRTTIDILPLSGRKLRVKFENEQIILEGDAREDSSSTEFDLESMIYR